MSEAYLGPMTNKYDRVFMQKQLKAEPADNCIFKINKRNTRTV